MKNPIIERFESLYGKLRDINPEASSIEYSKALRGFVLYGREGKAVRWAAGKLPHALRNYENGTWNINKWRKISRLLDILKALPKRHSQKAVARLLDSRAAKSSENTSVRMKILETIEWCGITAARELPRFAEEIKKAKHPRARSIVHDCINVSRKIMSGRLQKKHKKELSGIIAKMEKMTK